MRELTDLLRRVQNLEAQLSALKSKPSATGESTGSTSSSGGRVFLETITEVAADSGATSVAWTTYTLDDIPRSAKFLMLRFWVMVDGDTTDASIEYRANSDGPEYKTVDLVPAQSAGDTNTNSIFMILPFDRSNWSFDYQVTVTGDADYLIELLGYET